VRRPRPAGASAAVLLSAACAATNPAAHRFDRLVDGVVASAPVPPPSVYAAYLAAAIAYEQGRAGPEALAAVDRVIAWAPQDPHPWVLRAKLLAAAGRVEEAKAALAEALARSPGYGPARAEAARLSAVARTEAARSPGPDRPRR